MIFVVFLLFYCGERQIGKCLGSHRTYLTYLNIYVRELVMLHCKTSRELFMQRTQPTILVPTGT